MFREEGIKQNLAGKFHYLESHIQIQRPRRIYLELALENFREVFGYAVKQLNFNHLCTITGLDQGDNFILIYHLGQDTGILLNLKTSVPKNNPLLKTVIEFFPGAEIYERELIDLLGIKVEGLPPGQRYPLPDDWPADEHPLRKDWRPSAQGKKETEKNA